MSLSLTLLGTGTPAPLVHRAGSGYLIQLEKESLLFDCGPGTIRRLLETGISPTQISTLFLTHLHYDHCVDYGYLVLNRWDQGVGKIPDLEVYGPPPIQHMTELLFSENGAYGPDLSGRTKHPGSEFIYEMRGGVLPRKRPEPSVTEVAHGSVVEKDPWRVTTAEVVHCQPQLTCLAYRFDTSEGSIVFGGDTAPTQALTDLAQNADILLHMCHMINGVVTDSRITDSCSGHLDAARTAREANVQTLVLVHITEQLEQTGIRERILAEAAGIFSGQIIFGEDLLNIPLGTISPEKIR
ncbi:MAG: MBL fold metallo-hydrolase [bacterium]|nr:MBL fold metallo-hydrolase [bacterium]